MDSPKKIDVGDWQASPLAIAPDTRARRHFLPPTFVGIVGTVLMHSLLIQAVVFGSRSPKSKPPEILESASVLSKSMGGDSLVLITLPTSANANLATTQNLVSSLSNLSRMKVKPQIDMDSPAFLSLETLALSEDQASSAVASEAEGTEQDRLFGIYSGQIQARIDRVWRRPRTPVNENATRLKPTDADESFQCAAQIIQDVRGNVQEIMLPRCKGSAAWRNSLVLAIQHASPLPAPPSEKVFNTSITLNFIGLSYFPGAPEDDYEAAGRALLSSQ